MEGGSLLSGWHEPDDSRGSRPDQWAARGKIPRADRQSRRPTHPAACCTSPPLPSAKMPCTPCDMGVHVFNLEFSDCAMFASRSTFAALLLSCLTCWLSCGIVFGEIPELISLTDDTSNDFPVRTAASADGVYALSVAKHGVIRILARAVEHLASGPRKSTLQDTTPTRSALFVVNSVLRR